ncbi:MAG: Fur family transcriptional regulator [Actinomycetota bacterium]
MTTDTAVEDIIGQLRASGGRITSPRRAILEALVGHAGHPTAEELTTAVQRRHPDVHESTVYRFLDDLERLRIVDHVHLGHGPAVYHFTIDSHHHLACGSCGVVIEIPMRSLTELRRKLRAQFAFEVDLRHFGIPGRCKACSGDG